MLILRDTGTSLSVQKRAQRGSVSTLQCLVTSMKPDYGGYKPGSDPLIQAYHGRKWEYSSILLMLVLNIFSGLHSVCFLSRVYCRSLASWDTPDSASSIALTPDIFNSIGLDCLECSTVLLFSLRGFMFVVYNNCRSSSDRVTTRIPEPVRLYVNYTAVHETS